MVHKTWHTHTHTHTLPGSGTFSGSGLVYQRCQSRGYCSNEAMSPWKLVSLSSSVMLSQLESDSQLEQGLSICFSLSRTYHTHTHTLQISFCNMRTFFFKQLKTIFPKIHFQNQNTHTNPLPPAALTSPPRRKKLYSSILSFLDTSRILAHMWKLNRSLWHSNSPRQVYLQTDQTLWHHSESQLSMT